MDRKLVIACVAGLSVDAVDESTPTMAALAARGARTALEPPLAGLTGPSQASLLTGSQPAEHGIVANGWYERSYGRIFNWPRSAGLVGGTPLWELARAARPGLRCASLFMRFATHSSCDVVVVERPTYWADGRKSPDAYASPSAIGERLRARYGTFPLFRFWGPAAGLPSTRWIMDATLDVMADDGCELVLTYLPHLDYDVQRFGPGTPQARAAATALDGEVARLAAAAEAGGWDLALVGDYGYEPVERPIYLNRALREAGLLAVTREGNGEILEAGASRAFAVCDQQLAHVYVRHTADLTAARAALEAVEGVERVLGGEALAAAGMNHARAGELIAIAAERCWFAYPYWLDERDAPDFAHCVAIHDKPGFDPGELLLGSKLHLGWRLLQKIVGLRAPFDVIAGAPERIGGAHGRPPTSDATRPLLITSWPAELEPGLPMHRARDPLLERLGALPSE